MSQLKEEMSKGGISADMVANAFKAATSQGGLFYGSMDKQSKTFAGQMSTLSDNVKSTFGKVFESTFKNISENILPTVNNAVGAFGDTFKKTGSFVDSFRVMISTVFPPNIASTIFSITDKITGLAFAFKGIITGDEETLWLSFTDWLKISPSIAEPLLKILMTLRDAAKQAFTDVFGWITNNGPTVKLIISGIVGAMVAYKTAVIASRLSVLASNAVMEVQSVLFALNAIKCGFATEALAAMTVSTDSSTAAQWLLNAAMNANPIGILITIIGALIGALIYLYNTNESVRKVMDACWNLIKNTIVEKVTEAKNFFVNAFNAILNFVENNWKQILLFIVNPISGAIALLYNNNPKFRQWADNAANAIKEGFNAAVKFMEELPGKALRWGKDMLDNFINGIKAKFAPLTDAVSWIGNKIKGILGHSVPTEGPLKNELTWMPDMINNLTQGVEGNKGKLIKSIQGMASDMSLNLKGDVKTNKASTSNLSSGPLFVIQQFVNNSDKDIETLMYQMEYARQRAARALGGE